MIDTDIETADQTDEPVHVNSRKREVAGVVASMAVTIALGIVATGVIEKLGRLVRERIAPPAEETSENE